MFQTSIPFSSSRRHIILFSGAQFGDHVSGGCFGVFHLQRASPGQQHHGGCGCPPKRPPRRAPGCHKPLRHHQLINQLSHLLLVWKQVQNHIHAGTTFTRLATNNNPLSIYTVSSSLSQAHRLDICGKTQGEIKRCKILHK